MLGNGKIEAFVLAAPTLRNTGTKHSIKPGDAVEDKSKVTLLDNIAVRHGPQL